MTHLKRNERMQGWPTFLDSFGWVGITYAASALVAGLLYMAFMATGIGVMAGAVPLMIVLLVMLHYHFRQRESDDQAQQHRIEAAEREAAQAARHLAELRTSEQRFHSAFSHAAIGMALVTAEGEVLQVNGALCTLLGRVESAMVGQPFETFVHADDTAALAHQWRAVLARESGDATIELRFQRPDRELAHISLHSGYFSDLDASAACLILQLQDITARREAEAKLHHIAYHDGLTSLANRMRLRRLPGAGDPALPHRTRLPVRRHVPGLRPFQAHQRHPGPQRRRSFPDPGGRSASGAQVRPVDTVGRLGGDEFAVLLDNLGDEAALLAMAERLQSTLARTYLLDGTEVTSSASIGITFSSVGYDTPGDVLRDADIAMYRPRPPAAAAPRCSTPACAPQLALQVQPGA